MAKIPEIKVRIEKRQKLILTIRDLHNNQLLHLISRSQQLMDTTLHEYYEEIGGFENFTGYITITVIKDSVAMEDA